MNVRNITGRKSIEKTPRDLEELLRAYLESAPDGVYTSDLKGTFLSGNNKAEEMTGYKREELIGKSYLKVKLLPFKFLAKAGKLLALNAMGKPTGPDEFELIRKDGSRIWTEISTTPVKHGEKTIVIGFVRDITKRKRAEEEMKKLHSQLELLVDERTAELKAANETLEQDITQRRQVEKALRESVRRHRLLAENVIDVIWTMDMNLRFTYISPSVTSMLGYSVEEAMTKTLEEILTPTSLDVAMKTLTDRMAEENVEQRDAFRPVTVELEFNCKDGSTVWSEVKATFLGDPGSQPVGFVGVARDITERKQAEQRLQELYEHEKELRQQLEAETKKRIEFTRALVHELKTPITPVLAASELLIEELKEETLLGLAQSINRGASNLNRRIDELLDLARGEIGMLRINPKTVDPVQLLQEIVHNVTPIALQNRQSLSLQLPSSLPAVWADEGRLGQVVLNLVTNAFKFTHTGGKITLRAEEDGANLIVEVQDTGRGISKEDQQRLFEPYHQLESEGANLSGLGLGLALSKRLVELHGGRIWVKGRKGEGSTFGFSVPLEAAAEREKGVETGWKL